MEISEVSEFLILALIQKWKTRKTQEFFQNLQLFYWRKLEISEVSEFSILILIQKSKTRKTQKLSQDL